MADDLAAFRLIQKYNKKIQLDLYERDYFRIIIMCSIVDDVLSAERNRQKIE